MVAKKRKNKFPATDFVEFNVLLQKLAKSSIKEGHKIVLVQYPILYKDMPGRVSINCPVRYRLGGSLAAKYGETISGEDYVEKSKR